MRHQLFAAGGLALLALWGALLLAPAPAWGQDETPDASAPEPIAEAPMESDAEPMGDDADPMGSEGAEPTDDKKEEPLPNLDEMSLEEKVDAIAGKVLEVREETDKEDPAKKKGDILGDLSLTTYHAIDNIVLFFAAVLVLFMQAGFAMVEIGLNQAKHVVNILFKNVMDLSLGILLFWLVGYGIMYPGDAWSIVVSGQELFGFAQVGTAGPLESITGDPNYLEPQIDFLFQAAFAATAATIVSGAVAGRMKFTSYLIYSVVLTGLIYPISGAWKWGGGWLQDLETSFGYPFQDFAGSVVVHAVGGFAGLAGAIALGPRLGRYDSDGKSVPIPGHNLAFAALGVFILWIGWYGFNPGSQLTFTGVANIQTTMEIAVNTSLAAAAGVVVATIVAWIMFSKPDLTMGLNGALAGLVGITANCDQVVGYEAIIIGAVAGVLVVLSIVALDKLKIDDPVGAFPVHGVCGVWGGLATGIFGSNATFMPQLIGSIVIPVWAFVTMAALFFALKAIGQLRVSADEETEGLDIGEHGQYAYPPSIVAAEGK